MRRFALTLACLGALAGFVAGCGDDEGSTISGAGTTRTTGAAADGETPRGTVTIRTVTVGEPGNSSVGVVTTFVASKGNFVQIPSGADVFPSCDDAPAPPPDCFDVGAVDYEYAIGELEVTVPQYVAFLNTVDPEGRNERELYHDYMSPSVWPKYGSIAFTSGGQPGEHYSVAAPQWEDKPFGFANFLRSARFANSLYNGDVLSRSTSTSDGFTITTYKVRLGRESEKGMYDMTDPKTTRKAQTGFVIPSNNEWLKAAYYDPKGGGTDSYWLYPTGPSKEPNASKLDRATGDVVNASDQPLATFSPQGPKAPRGTYPTWCPPAAARSCRSVNPGNLPPGIASQAFQGNLSTVGQTRTRSPWGTLDQGGNVVEWQDTIVPSFEGYSFKRVWRRMHGGVANAPSYQMLINAFGFQPQDQVLMDGAYPWFGLRVGVIGDLG